MQNDKLYDAVIIGGSYAGLSAALVLGRSRRKVIVIDDNTPCNRYSPHSHNFLTHDGESPDQIRQQAKRDVSAYPTVEIINDTVKQAEKNEQFVVTTKGGLEFKAKKLLFATGVCDQFPDIDGFGDCWGKSVLHCPYCHGYEVRDKKTLILANGRQAYEMAGMLSNWSKDVTLLTNGKSELSEDETAQLERNGIRVIEKKIDSIGHSSGQVEKVHFADGSHMEAQVMYAKIPVKQSTDVPEKLGCKVNEDVTLSVNEWQETTVSGIYAAGDATSVARIISYAVAAGTKAGIAINTALVSESFN